LPVPGQRRWIHYGSSISHCMEAAQPTGTWPAVAARRAGWHLQSLGFGGQCHLDPFVARTIRDAQADLISIKAGINVINADSMRERVFAPALHGFLDTIREGRPDTPIVLVSPIFCPSAEHRPGPTQPDAAGKFVTLAGHEAIQAGCLTLTRVREILADVVDVRRRGGDRQLHYLDGLRLFGAADAADLPDDLHPNPAGYVRMGERFVREVFSSDGLGLS
ncbi:MAG: lipase, partial [Burkholderiaceae bacterium]|nr:lipase [Burkholderiaceae bacterium]